MSNLGPESVKSILLLMIANKILLDAELQPMSNIVDVSISPQVTNFSLFPVDLISYEL